MLGRPGREAATGARLVRVEDQHTGAHVRIALEVVGVRMMGVVLGDPPAEAHAAHQVAVHEPEEPHPVGVPGDLEMTDVVSEEPHLRGDHPEHRGEQQQPPRVLPDHHRGDHGGQGREHQGEVAGVRPGPAAEQPELTDLGCQLAVPAASVGVDVGCERGASRGNLRGHRPPPLVAACVRTRGPAKARVRGLGT